MTRWISKWMVSLFAVTLIMSLLVAVPAIAQTKSATRTPLPANALDPSSLIGKFTTPEGLEFAAEAGEWVRYRVHDKQIGEEYVITLAKTGIQPLAGGLATWLEFTIENDKGMSVVLRVLWLAGKELSPVRRMIMKTGDHMAIELNVASLKPPRRKSKGMFENSDAGEITVKAGTFKCGLTTRNTLTGESHKLWHAVDVPLFRIVKASSQYSEMELIATGKKYLQKITEKPLQLERTGGKPFVRKK